MHTPSPFAPVGGPPESLEEIDLTDPALYQVGDPHGCWHLLRERAPVWRHQAGHAPVPFWAVTRYEDVAAVYRDGVTFSCREADTLFSSPQSMGGDNLVTMDGDRHYAMRQVVSRYFTRRAVAELANRTEIATDRVVREVAAKPCLDVDFVTEIAARIPILVLSDLMGVPEEDYAIVDDIAHPRTLDTDAYLARVWEYLARLLDARGANPGSDLSTVIAQAAGPGELMTRDEALSYLWLLLVGGTDTTRHMMSGAVVTLAHYPDQWRRLVADRSLVEPAVEEVLRWVAVAQHNKRVVTVDCILGGTQIRAGDFVAVFPPSANRDERAFSDPQCFDIGRRPNRHLTFATGAHMCLGASLARLEMRALLAALARHMPHFTLAGDVLRQPSYLFPEIDHIPLSW